MNKTRNRQVMKILGEFRYLKNILKDYNDLDNTGNTDNQIINELSKCEELFKKFIVVQKPQQYEP